MTIKRVLLSTALFVVALATAGRAQQASSSPPKLTIFKVDVVLTRLEGVRELGSSPFSLIISGARNVAKLRIGVEVPNGTVTENGRTETAFKTIGTQIDAFVTSLTPDEGRYPLQLSIGDTAVVSDPADAARVSDLTQNLELARKSLERQKELFTKSLTTQQGVDRAATNVASAERALAMAAKFPKPLGRADQMAFRSFTSSNLMYIHDGETVRASVKLTVVK